MDHSSPNYVARLFYFKKMEKNDDVVQQNSKMLVFVKKSLRSYMPNTKVGKNNFPDIIHSKLTSLIICHQNQSKSIKTHINLVFFVKNY